MDTVFTQFKRWVKPNTDHENETLHRCLKWKDLAPGLANEIGKPEDLSFYSCQEKKWRLVCFIVSSPCCCYLAVWRFAVMDY